MLLDWVPRAAILDEEYVDAIPRSVAASVQFLHEECSVTPDAPPAEWHEALEVLLPRVRGRAADAAPLMRQVRTFLDWIGDGRPVTKTGNLKVADGYELVDVLGTDDLAPIAGMPRPRVQSAAELNDVDWVYTLARTAGWASTSATRLYAEPDEGADPLDRWERLWLALVSVGPVDHHHGGHRTPVAGHIVDMLDEGIVELLLSLHEAGTGLSIDDLVDEVVAEGMLGRSLEDAIVLQLYEQWTAREVHHLLDRLAGVGVLEVEEVEWVDDDGWTQPRGGVAQLTPLGAWALSRVLGVAADQLSMADVALEDLLDVIDASDEQVWSAKLDAWTRQHPDAIGEVVDAIRRGVEGGMVEVGFALLHSWGEQAVPHVRALVDEPEVGALARVFLARYGDEDAAASLDVDAPEAMVELLASILDVFGPQALVDEVDGLGPLGEQAELFERLWRVDHPGAERVLETWGSSTVTRRSPRRNARRCSS